MSPLQLRALLNKRAFRGRASHWRRMERTHPKGKTDNLHLYCWGNRDDSYLVCQSVPLYSVNTVPSFKCMFHVLLLPFWILSVNLYSLKLGESHDIYMQFTFAMKVIGRKLLHQTKLILSIIHQNNCHTCKCYNH